jgi:hypothetical protein
MTTPLTFAAGDLTIHRIVEIAGPAMGVREILSGLTKQVLAEHQSFLAGFVRRLGDGFTCVGV